MARSPYRAASVNYIGYRYYQRYDDGAPTSTPSLVNDGRWKPVLYRSVDDPYGDKARTRTRSSAPRTARRPKSDPAPMLGLAAAQQAAREAAERRRAQAYADRASREALPEGFWD